MSKNSIHIKRVYEDESPKDGKRILCDRLWPRGVKKEDLKPDAWAKEIAPSSDLRKKYHEGLLTCSEFEAEYFKELEKSDEIADFIVLVKGFLKTDDVTLLYSAKNTECNNATVLRDYLTKELGLKK